MRSTRNHLVWGGGGQRGFTVTEILVATLILVVIIIATARIFGIAGQVTETGEATSDVMQEAAAIERQLREDFASLDSEGFFAIRCVAVRNDVNGAALLNPNLPDNALIRADQLVFFRTGTQTVQSFRLSAGSNRRGQSTSSRLYWGHAFQLPVPQGLPFGDAVPNRARDIAPDEVILPWQATVSDGPVNVGDTYFRTGNSGGTDNFTFTAAGTTDRTQPPARQWLLVRQAALLADDDDSNINSNAKTVFLGENPQARSIFLFDPLLNAYSPQLRDGRVDAAATQLDDIRRRILFDPLGNSRPWFGANDQRSIIRSAIYYPRGERVAPSMHRVDQALTNGVISSACSSFRVDWTYEDGAGEGAIAVPSPFEHPWFGLRDDTAGVKPLIWWLDDAVNPDDTKLIQIDPASPFDPTTSTNTVEWPMTGLPAGVTGYEAFFGFDHDLTPWPSAVRITMTLHDPETTLENGRVVQFVIRLPERGQ